MFAKFNYSPSGYFYNTSLNPCLELGKSIYSKHEKEVQECLSTYITEDGVINGTDLKDHWFSISKKDIFISHSHRDINKVKAFAGWLHNTFGLEAFIDSCSWGYCDDLLNKIDKRYCYNPKTRTYDYTLRNYTTSHVHMMLSTALAEMIDNTECIIFFNTPNSINLSEELDNVEKKQSTISPWIYHELSASTMMQIKPPNRRSFILEHCESRYSYSASSKLTISYDVSKQIKNMVDLSDSMLTSWAQNYSKRPLSSDRHPLDFLYDIIFPKGESQK